MKSFLTAVLLLPAAALAQTPDWNFTPTAASGSLLGTVTVNGAPAAAGTWIGAFDPCASPTSRTMPASSVALPTPVAVARSMPS